jgi:flagellar hook-basal body complex protein FliE
MSLTPLTSALTGLGGLSPKSGGAAPASDSPGGFGDTLTKLMNEVQTSSGDANDAIGKMLDGTGEVHDAMIAVQKADMTLQLTVQIRNKLVQAYQDVMRMPV